MWQTPNQKARNATSKRSIRDSRGRQSLHMKRVDAEIRTVGKRKADGSPEVEAMARILMNDLNAKGVGIFCTEAFVAGEEVAITLTSPSMIYLRGKVSYCQEREHTHIISEVPYQFRIGIVFVFESAAEKAAVAKYCDGVVRTLVKSAA